MKATGYIKTCPNCNREFELFSDDGVNDDTVCWNYCPHCGHKNNVWVRKRMKDDTIEQVPLGLDHDGGRKLRDEYADLFYIKACPTVRSKVDYDSGEPVLIEGWFRVQELYKSGRHGGPEGEPIYHRAKLKKEVE